MNPVNQESGPHSGGASAFSARAALALCGFTAVVGQIVLTRELMQVFNGNEISVGITLATWLLWTAMGSGAAGLLGVGRRFPRTAVAYMECLLAVSLPLTVAAVRAAKALLQTVPGELVGPVPMLLVSLACLSVFCGCCGALFVAAARMAESEAGLTAHAAAGGAYLVEAVGSGVGGILASVVLVQLFDPMQIAVCASLLNLCMAIGLWLRPRRALAAVLVAVAVIAAIPLLYWIAPRWDTASRALLWRGLHLVASRDTLYGNLTVTQTGDRANSAIRTLYTNGTVLANAPDPAAAEEAVHYALLEHASPRRVLLIDGGVNGAVAEALQHPTVERLDYVELDPALIAMARQYFPAQTAVLNSDPRVHLHLLDGRRYLSQTGETFDVLIVDVPDPQTAQLNRFYTVEFFRLARAHLTPGGLLALELRSSEETISPDLAEFLRSIRRTLGEVFPYQAAIPGETIHFFGAAQPGVLTRDPAVLVARLQARQLATQYVREYFIPYRMTADRMAQVETELAPTPTTPVNRDFAPIAYAFDVVLWSAQFRSGYAAWFRAAAHVPFRRAAFLLVITLLTAVALIALLPGRERRQRATAGSCVTATGFTLMALQIFLLLGFQAVYGYVYAELAILIGLFMAGIALGSWLGMRHGHGLSGGMLTTMQLLLAISCPVLLLAIRTAANMPGLSWLAARMLFPVLAGLAGALGGFQFVVAVGIFLRDQSGRAGLGLLYAIDLLGGCVGALALSGFLIPFYGFWRTAWLVAAINLAAFLPAVRLMLISQTGAEAGCDRQPRG